MTWYYIDESDLNIIKAYCDKFETTAHLRVDDLADNPYMVYIQQNGKVTYFKTSNWPSGAARRLADQLRPELYKGTHLIYQGIPQ